MSTLPPLTEADIEQSTTARSFERGFNYYQGGSVLSVTRRGLEITAEVAGSSYTPYQVHVTLDKTGIDHAHCSCPYDWGGYCKHIVAVLLHIINETDTVEERPELANLLENLDREQLQTLLLNLVKEHPNLVELIEQEIKWTALSSESEGTAPGDLEKSVVEVRREVQRAMRKLDAQTYPWDEYDDYYDEGPPDGILEPHLDYILNLLDGGNAQGALAIAEAVAEEWIDGLNNLDEWYYEAYEDFLSEAIYGLDYVLAEALLSIDLAPDGRKTWEKKLGKWEDLSGTPFYVSKTAVRQGWDYPPLVRVLQGEITNKGAWVDEAPMYADELAQARLNVLAREQRFQEYLYLAQAEGQMLLYLQMLAQLGRADEAVSEGLQYLNQVTEAHSLAQTLYRKGEKEAAFQIAAHGLKLEGYNKGFLAQWLRDKAMENGRMEMAREAAEVAFMQTASFNDYRAAEKSAGETWPQMKKRLLHRLEERGHSAGKVDIYLHENMVKEAMHAVEEGYWDTAVIRVIEAAREQYPQWAIDQCRRRAERIMNAGQSQQYDVAVSWLRRARPIYMDSGQQDAWYAYLDELLTQHGRKYKLVPMLKEIR